MNERFSELRVLRWAERITDVLHGEKRGPIRCNLDLTNLCSHQCPWCEPLAFREQTIRDRKHTLDTRTAFEVIDDLVELDCKTLNLSGGGEPTLHPEFGELLLYAAGAGLRTWVVTHGGHIDKWLDDLVFASHVRISLDAANEEQHQQMHHAKAGEWARVIENITALCAARREPRTEVGISYLLSECNSDSASLHKICDLASCIGVDFIHFRPLSLETSYVGMNALMHDAMYEAAEVLPGKFPDLTIFPIGKRGEDVFTQREFDKCYAALTLAVVGATGDLQACCDERGIVFGNVYEKRFKDIWLSAQHRERADAIVPRLCSRCVMCSINRGIERNVVQNHALPELL
jgi:MoaA/NifB/PqqE/SkfB family radical SAM enzyme